MVGQPVQEGAGEAFGTEGFGPFFERQIAGDQRRAALIALRDQLEEKFSAGFAEGNLAQLIDDQQFDLRPRALQAQQALLVSGFHQFVDQR